ncbi:MAG: bifunctional lysylphosphatidylglycerol flippase/synthetase MprF [Gammaproteobacteria bacterium]|nr:bifunctional lysylphosphatidylglycerol flippase/synthetase MprF [Gammaproteobacteria bacterium]
MAGALFVLRALHGLLGEVRYADILAAVHAMPVTRLALAACATAVSYLALAGYDAIALRYVGARARLATVLHTAFIAFAFSNTVGLGVLTGGAVRLRLYGAAGVEATQVARAVGFNAAAFAVGVGTFGALGLVWDAPALAALLHLPAGAVAALGGLVLAAVAILIVVCAPPLRARLGAHWQRLLPTSGLVLAQIGVSALDLAAAAGALWCLLPDGAASLASFLAFYAVAVALGALSHVPGGLGVFEAVILLACAGRAPPEQVAGALLLYRVVYHLLPLALAVLLLVGHELRGSLATPQARAAVRLLPAALAGLSVIAGSALLLSGATPLSGGRADLLALHLPLPLVETAHLFGSIAGLALLFVARGLFHRLDAAWWAAVVLLVTATLLALPNGLPLSQACGLALVAGVLVIARRQFDRRSKLFEQSFEWSWWLCVAAVLAVCGWMLFFAYRDLEYGHQLWWQFEFDGHAPRSLRAMMAVALLALAMALAQLFRAARLASGPPSVEALARAAEVVETQTSADAGLVLLGDKRLLFSASGSAFIMYGQSGRSWIALFDPIGPAHEWPELVWRFIELADEHGCRPAFYQVRAQALPLYLDAGLRVFKLGEEAHVPLADFSLEGSRRAKLRQAVNRAEREGLRFEVVAVEALPALLATLRAVSDAWLDGHQAQEKSFSLGSFEDDYVLRQPVAVVRQGERVVAFATLLATAAREECSVDLMRHLPDAPNGTMDYLFTRLMLHFKEQGYARFNLGMAPMSGMATHPLAARWHRFGRLVFEHGERFYNFRGLRSFKEKFDPTWEPRYLAAPGGLAPLLVLGDVATLIAGGLRGIVAK